MRDILVTLPTSENATRKLLPWNFSYTELVNVKRHQFIYTNMAANNKMQ